ncbi:MAG: tRNA 2-selenouridine(34) synthase MnmH, partial [Flavitalea sp.]
QKVETEQFISYAEFHPVLDVRSPAEYNHAHIPGAISFPLFTDEERKVVGTLYKQRSREDAIKEGLVFFGPKMRAMIEKVEEILAEKKFNKITLQQENFVATNCVLVHCWRGGMRSGAVAWLLDLYGFKVFTLNGGYKKFRNHVISAFEKNLNASILGGYTGSGKSYLLQELHKRGKRIIDLELIANHKGSAFGTMGEQPTQEMFENLLGLAIHELLKVNNEPIWFEDESQRIGSVNIPSPLWNQMREAQILFVDIPFEERLNHIVAEYGKIDKEKLINSIVRISKRLGGLETKTAINHLLEGNIRECFDVLLKYYDKWYLKGLNNRENLEANLIKLPSSTVDSKTNASMLIETMNNFYEYRDQ